MACSSYAAVTSQGGQDMDHLPYVAAGEQATAIIDAPKCHAHAFAEGRDAHPGVRHRSGGL
jgi:hypothetical protein